MRCFLSHNKADRRVARKIGAHMTLVGMDVWFDEWEIQAGDSIPGKLNTGLAGFDAFILVWSANADRSNWVRQELNSAIMRSIQDNSAKIVPCLLDATPLPPLVADRRGIDFSDEREGILALAGELTGVRARRDRLLAIQGALDELDVNWNLHPMVNPLVCCPRCGEEKLEAFEQDYAYDRRAAGLWCPRCKWSAGGDL
jgi:TIR domain